MNDIIFTFHTSALGRNGTSKAIGVGLTDLGNVIQIQPKNTKGLLTKCVIRIPKTDIPAFCSELRSMCNDSLFETIAEITKNKNQ